MYNDLLLLKVANIEKSIEHECLSSGSWSQLLNHDSHVMYSVEETFCSGRFLSLSRKRHVSYCVRGVPSRQPSSRQRIQHAIKPSTSRRRKPRILPRPYQSGVTHLDPQPSVSLRTTSIQNHPSRCSTQSESVHSPKAQPPKWKPSSKTASYAGYNLVTRCSRFTDSITLSDHPHVQMLQCPYINACCYA